MSNASSISKLGLLPGGLADVQARGNCYFSEKEWDETSTTASGDRMQGGVSNYASLTGPRRVAYRPRASSDAKSVFNFHEIKECGLDPRRDPADAVTTKSGRSVPP